MTWPALIGYVDGVERVRLTPPDALVERAWLLAVMAVQVNVVGGRRRAILRSNRTGHEPDVIELPDAAVVHIAVGGDDAELPELDAPDTPTLALHIDGALVQSEPLDAALTRTPTPRAFGHVYSRWLRDGGHETGYDITPFASVPRGQKHARSASGETVVGTVISYAIRV